MIASGVDSYSYSSVSVMVGVMTLSGTGVYYFLPSIVVTVVVVGLDTIAAYSSPYVSVVVVAVLRFDGGNVDKSWGGGWWC